MKIAFYAPMKSPRHPVPSGDRLMARQLVQVLGLLDAEVRLASELRTYVKSPDIIGIEDERLTCEDQARRLIRDWQAEDWRPDVWFCYHPYYKALDWLGAAVVAQFGAVHVTAEASYPPGRRTGPWQHRVEALAAYLASADCHFYLKERDRAGLAQLAESQADLVHVPPFVDTEPYERLVRTRTGNGPLRLVTVAMMRRDVKLESYRYLARALASIQHLDWKLDVAGDGDARSDVEAAFQDFAPSKVRFLGQLDSEAVRDLLSASDLFVWPGFGEAYGLAYLEAQATGLPVVAQDIAGVANVVKDGETGLLCEAYNVAAFSAGLERFISDRLLLQHFGSRARAFVLGERSLQRACDRIGSVLNELLARDRGPRA